MNETKWSRQVPNYGIRFISEKKCEVTDTLTHESYFIIPFVIVHVL